MGISYLSRVCASVLFAAALIVPLSSSAADKPNYFYNAATKTWIPTRDAIVTPQGTIINNSAASQAQRFLDGQGGFVNKSTVHANFPAVKKTVPITIDAKTPPSRVKLGAKNLLKGGIAGIVLSEGLQLLLDGIGGLIQDGQVVTRTVPVVTENPPEGSIALGATIIGTAHPTIEDGSVIAVGSPFMYSGFEATYICAAQFYSAYFVGYNPSSQSCYFMSGVSPLEGFDYAPTSPHDIDAAVDSSYVPHVSDWEWLAPYMEPTAIEITDLPRLMSPPVTKTVYDADGKPVQISETNIWHDFDIRNNDSARPEIDVKTTEQTKVYEDGTLVSTNTTTSTSAADPNAVPSADGGGDFEIPTDCDFMPTVCAFIDWFKDDDLGADPDLKSIMKDDGEFSRSKTISFGAAVCPAPHTINLPSLGMSVDLSFEFFCQFAEYARALVLAAAYIFAAYISLGVARG